MLHRALGKQTTLRAGFYIHAQWWTDERVSGDVRSTLRLLRDMWAPKIVALHGRGCLVLLSSPSE